MKKIAYPIRAVSQLTGISIDTLRAWERRYQAVKPRRDDGERVYEDGDVERLILLRRAVEGGHGIGRIAGLGNEELREIVGRSVEIGAPVAEPARAQLEASLDLGVLLDAIHRFGCLELNEELSRLAALLPPRRLVHQVVVPLMKHVGDQWYRGQLSIAQEHMVSGALRNLLGSLLRLYAREEPSKTLLFATPQGERHEFGILCAAMLAASGGLGIAYLGPDLPSTEIVDALEKTSPAVLVLGLKGAVSAKEPMRDLHRIAEKLPPSVELWAGGVHSADHVRQIRTAGAVYLRNLAEFEQQLIRTGASF